MVRNLQFLFDVFVLFEFVGSEHVFTLLITEQLYWSIIYIPQNFPILSVPFNDC